MTFAKPFICIFQAILLFISSFSAYDSTLKKLADQEYFSIISEDNFSFDSLTSKEAVISESEKKKCRDWYNDNILTSTNPAYNFTVDGKKLKDNISDWNFSIGNESQEGAVFRGGKTTYVTLTHKNSNLTATVEATIYEEYATCDWTVFIENSGNDNSPVIKDFYAADCNLDIGKSDIYYLYGSDNDREDFTVGKVPFLEDEVIFSANAGRNTSWLPYFNLDGDNYGVMTAVGWTGQWHTSFDLSSAGVSIKAKQEHFNSYLTAGEKVRSPLVSFSFYETGNPLKGYNIYRSYSKDLLVDENIEQRIYQCYGGSVETIRTFADFLDENGILEYIDTFWFDAEKWFYKDENDSWYRTAGDWTARTDWYPNGFVEVCDLLDEKGLDTMLWFEPERVRPGTLFYKECSKRGWLISNGSLNYLLNLADDECCDWYINYMVTFFKENHLDELRQDFNINPLSYWQKNDTVGRKGITENHYVTNLYRYLDTMLSSIDNLRIDNCSSGGRRIDCEMMKRSVPLWRSDYQCDVRTDASEATQLQTYGLSLVLPYSCINYPWALTDYELLSNITPIKEVHDPLSYNYPEKCLDHLKRYDKVKEYLIENYYPLTPKATVDDDTWIAMQFGTGESGLVFAYRHANADDTISVKLSEIDPDADYILSYPFDDSAKRTSVSGADLQKGLTIKEKNTPDAVVIEYKKTTPPA